MKIEIEDTELKRLRMVERVARDVDKLAEQQGPHGPNGVVVPKHCFFALRSALSIGEKEESNGK